jgi:hypothetical protein
MQGSRGGILQLPSPRSRSGSQIEIVPALPRTQPFCLFNVAAFRIANAHHTEAWQGLRIWHGSARLETRNLATEAADAIVGRSGLAQPGVDRRLSA